MRSRGILLSILCVSVALRLILFAFAYHNLGSGYVSGDAVGYTELGYNLAHGNGFVSTMNGALSPEVFRSPGLPLLIAPFTLAKSGIVLYSIVFSILGGLLLPLFTYQIGARLAGSRSALIAAALVAIEPHAVMYSFLPQSEVPFMLFAFGGLATALAAYDSRSRLLTIFAGALWGYAALIRPGFLDVLVPLLLATALVLFFRKDAYWRYLFAALALVAFVLLPWGARNQSVTGTFALSGEGWRNIYTDYLASIRSLQHGTSFIDEKNNLKDTAQSTLGLSRFQLNDPANASTIRNAALKELWRDKATVAKLEASLLFTFFFNDGYYFEFRGLGYIADAGQGQHISPTYEFLQKGLASLPEIFGELARQAFVPLWGRLFTFGTAALGIAGFCIFRSRLKWALAGAIILVALESTAIGLGLDARLRVPIEPLIFLFDGAFIVWVFERLRVRRST